MYKPRKELILDIKFWGIDFWSRPIFKVVDSEFYLADLNLLFPNDIAPNGEAELITAFYKENSSGLVIFGTDIDCDPDGTTLAKHVKLNILDHDKNEEKGKDKDW
jgi:hypothetical protein